MAGFAASPTSPASGLRRAQAPAYNMAGSGGMAAPSGAGLTFGAGGSGTPPQPAGGGHYTAPTGQNTLGNMTYDPSTGMVGSAGIGITPEAGYGGASGAGGGGFIGGGSSSGG